MEKELSFEDYINKLDQEVRKLENKEISLEEAVKSYTLGLELSKKCYDILKKNEDLVVKEMTDAGLKDFNEE